MEFKVKLSKSPNQQLITIVQTDNVNISGMTTATADVYTDDLGTADTSYDLTVGEVSDLASGEVVLSASDLGMADDDFYTVILTCSGSLVSAAAGVGITLEATSEVYSNQGSVNVYSPDYRVDSVLMTAKMLLDEMNAIENMEVSLQKRADYTTRLGLLKDILKY